MTAPRDRLLAAAVEYFAAEGIGDTSLRAIAGALDTSHRMLIYHFGSREGLLAAVVHAVERQQRDALDELMADTDLPPAEQAMRLWRRVTEAALTYGPLFFELSAHAVRDRPYTAPLREGLVWMWLPPLTELYRRAGMAEADAHAGARLGLGAARGLLLDLLATGDRAGVEQAVELLQRLLFAAGAAHPKPGG